MCSLRQRRVQVAERAAASSNRGTLMRIASLLSVSTLLALASAGALAAQGTLTPQDRAEIQELSAKYARLIGSCAANV
jgi:hypothetical protein